MCVCVCVCVCVFACVRASECVACVCIDGACKWDLSCSSAGTKKVLGFLRSPDYG